ncbi:hypothetical protein VCRA2119O147_1590011 [Vibrio crassostreae]|uniref:Uncharacterized protein n=2 Tax=Vibrio TaxID=662 RepID=A0A822N2B2_9VIBR|nr:MULTISPECIES: hypothetical protein [Vibrio]MDH5924190.1 hypothetical protein [Vibrio splendidus]MDH5953081.1 hypothetical protein [Vibrio crassostreae]CAK2041377.1 hypothetical protein VCRA2116O31_380024 [Vibrio crassostreae]CAK2043567.1 hypothetical protein VCRA2113O324_360024 [Vibrio crassostreae]CAK2043920.1 hypothetical protein VCRA2116O26_390026 [Vibrio crassostreae]
MRKIRDWKIGSTTFIKDYLAANPDSMIYVPAKENIWLQIPSSRVFLVKLKPVSLLML